MLLECPTNFLSYINDYSNNQIMHLCETMYSYMPAESLLMYVATYAALVNNHFHISEEYSKIHCYY